MIPTILCLEDVVSLDVAVKPFLHQLSWTHVEPLIYGKVPALEWYLATNPVITSSLACGIISILCFLAQEVMRNSSQVDRLWSILPAMYIGHYSFYSHMAGLETMRIDTLATFFTMWGTRLTFNFWRKGGYQKGNEDYRHEILAKFMGQPLYTIWGFFFLAVYQNILLMLVSMPGYIFVLIGSMKDYAVWSTMDTVFSQGLIVLLVLETLADQQQWSFQTAKKIYKEQKIVPTGYSAEDLDRGFVVTGLWSWSRHPNFACEQAIWVGMYQWTCFATNSMWNWAGLGTALYVLLFQGSTLFSESISAGKYPEYKEYQKLVNKFIPGFKSFEGLQEALTMKPATKASAVPVENKKK